MNCCGPVFDHCGRKKNGSGKTIFAKDGKRIYIEIPESVVESDDNWFGRQAFVNTMLHAQVLDREIKRYGLISLVSQKRHVLGENLRSCGDPVIRMYVMLVDIAGNAMVHEYRYAKRPAVPTSAIRGEITRRVRKRSARNDIFIAPPRGTLFQSTCQQETSNHASLLPSCLQPHDGIRSPPFASLFPGFSRGEISRPPNFFHRRI